MAKKPEHILRKLFDDAVAKCHPNECMASIDLPSCRGRTIVVGAGKAAGAMAAAYEQLGLPVDDGLVITTDGGKVETSAIRIVEAGHPIPDERGVAATKEILELARGLTEQDQLVVLLSGGGSALLCAPAPGLDLARKQSVIEALLASGAPIEEINCVRKHLSAVKGGRLAATAFPARCQTCAISDVVGNTPSTIASGPTVADPTSRDRALEILTSRNIPLDDVILSALSTSGEDPELIQDRFSRSHFELLTSPKEALEAAAAQAAGLGYDIVNLGDGIEGEAKTVAFSHAEQAIELSRSGKPTLLISGGELTVTKPIDASIGGPNHEYALALALSLNAHPDIFAIACDTDGKDGSSEAAGAIISPGTLRQAKDMGLNPARALKQHQSGTFFAELGTSVVSGPTQTNINDFRAILINPPDKPVQ